MTIQSIKDGLPDYAKDAKLNLGSVLSEEGAPGLTRTQILGTALASAYATGESSLIAAMEQEAKAHLSDIEVNGVRAATAVMAMNNVYYKSIDLIGDDEYGRMPANLRMNVMRETAGIPKDDFEIYSLAVSAVNGCGMCLKSHAGGLIKLGLSRQGVQSALRIAAVINSVAQVLVIESHRKDNLNLVAA